MAKERIKKEASERRKAVVRDTIKRFPDTPARTLARKLFAEHPEIFTSIESARDNVRLVLGVMGEGKRERVTDKTLYRPKRAAGAVPKMPESLAKAWEPFVVEGCKKVLVLSDIHVPFQDNEALEAALAYGETYNPDTILINGDLLDFTGISRYARDPRGPTVKDELDICADFLRHLRARFPKARIVFKLGNHDERWAHYLWQQAPALLDCVEFSWHELAGFKECDVEVIGDQRMVMLGKLVCLHGHELPKGLTNAVNPARGAFLRTSDSVLIGHHHRTSDHTERSMMGRVVVCWSTGCLCDLTPEYARVNKWDHGFATVDVAKSGDYAVELKRIVKGVVR